MNEMNLPQGKSELNFSKGQLSKTVVIRIAPGFDIIEGIEKVCGQLDIKAGVISCCIGSLQRAAYFIVVPWK